MARLIGLELIRKSLSKATPFAGVAFVLFTLCLGAKPSIVEAATGVHTTYLWHMHQPIYWPDQSGVAPWRYETAYETSGS